MVPLKHSFSPSFFEEEYRNDYYISQEVKQLWAVELDLLYEFDRVCRDNSLEYYLDAGTLLGAVRDGHFIPWDDDIDVVMFRDDYCRLVHELYDLFSPPYYLQTGFNEADYFRGHAQLRNSDTCAALPKELLKLKINQGIFLDIFVLDDIPADEKTLDTLFKNRYNIFRKRAILKNPADRNKAKHFAKLLYNRYLSFRYDSTFELYKEFDEIFNHDRDSEYTDKLMARKNAGQVKYLRKRWYSKRSYLKFEDGYFPVPGDYKEVLKTFYGEDYIVPKNIASVHNEEGKLIIDVDHNYKEVIARASTMTNE